MTSVLSPAREPEDVADATAPRLGCPDITGDGAPLVKGNDHRIKALDILGETILGPLVFGLKCAEESIPDDEDTRVVSIQIFRVATVMNAMMGRRVEDPFEGTHLFDEFRVDPKHKRAKCVLRRCMNGPADHLAMWFVGFHSG